MPYKAKSSKGLEISDRGIVLKTLNECADSATSYISSIYPHPRDIHPVPVTARIQRELGGKFAEQDYTIDLFHLKLMNDQ